MRARRRWREAAASAAWLAAGTALWLAPLELGARWWIERRGDALDKAAALLREDARLGWRQREGLATEFLGLSVRTDAAGFRVPDAGAPAGGAAPDVLVLGPSSAFGWGVREEDTYARRLERALRRTRPGASVLNAGEIGFSSWQGLALYRDELSARRPKVVLLAYGANGADRHRFFFDSPEPDAAALPPRAATLEIRAWNALSRLRAMPLLRRRLLAAAARWSCRPAPGAPDVPPVRVGRAEHEGNLDALVGNAREGGARVVLLTTPTRLPPAAGPEDCRVPYERAAAARRAGRCGEAEREQASARACEPRRLAWDLRAYNEAVRALARRRGVPLVDAERLLGTDPAQFVDPIHPSAAGHERIARALTEALHAR